MKSGVLPASGSYSVGDATEYLACFPDGHMSIATSPPYNRHFNQRTLKSPKASNWERSQIMGAGYDTHGDNMPESEYVEWQREFLAEAVRVAGKTGCVLYNIGRRIRDLSEDSRRDIVAGFPLRQTIIWDRGSTNNQGGEHPSIFPPIYELVYLLAGDMWRLPQRHVAEMRFWGDVWRIPFETGTEHPAPFPLALAERMVKTCGDRVCDPFAGSGTIGIAAARLGADWWLSDISENYKSMFQRRLAGQGNVLEGWKKAVAERE